MRPEPDPPRVEPVPVDDDAQAVAVLAEAFADYPALRYLIGPVGAAFPERLAALLGFFVAARRARGVSLSTETEANVGFYRALGFEVRGAVEVGPGVRSWVMFRPS